jgi:hypothetical protein
MAEFGLRGVLVVTFVQTPRLNGAQKKTGLFLRTLKLLVSAGVFDLCGALFRFLLTSWLMVGIKVNIRKYELCEYTNGYE